MTQYQSFPGAAGDSRSLDKLKALRLPVLAGKNFLDVGCNEGFFCGFAAYAGARHSVGLDRSAMFVERARTHFPHCEFIQGDWNTLPEGPFDVILLASALHYAEDQPALVHSLVSRLGRDGVLVLEIGVAQSANAEWVRTRRGIDERYFPSMPMVREMLAGYAWKWMGPSVMQDGDPVKRHIFHVSRPRPLAYLLMQPPAFGKTSIARSLFGASAVRVVSGDELVAHIAGGKVEASADLSSAVSEDFSPFRLDQAIRKVFDRGQGAELVQACIARAGDGDIALDMYVPQERHALVEQLFSDAGYLPVVLHWSRPGAELPSQEDLNRDADAFYLSLVQPGAPVQAQGADVPWLPAGCGFLDDIRYDEGRLELRGWAVDRNGDMPAKIAVSVGDRTLEIGNFERQIRQDVQRSLKLPHALLGYRMVLDLPGLSARAIARGLKLKIPGGATFGLSGPLDKMLAGGR